MVLFLHNRYRTEGGEERAVEDLMWLVREHLGEPVELLARSSLALGNARAAAGLLRGGLQPAEVAAAVRESGARVLHAHNLHPTLGWRALAAARAAGARVVLHLHQYRLVCATGVCFTRGQECTRCHGRNTLPGVLRNCRGAGRAEALAYGAALALWQRRLLAQADAIVVPSVFARERLRELGAPLPWERVHVLAPPQRDFAAGSRAGAEPRVADARYALIVARLAAEKGVDVAIEACARADVPLIVIGDGPERDALSDRVRGEGRAVILGRMRRERLAEIQREAAIALVPSRCGETFGLAAAEAMAAGVPVAASRVGALPEIVGEEGLVPPGDPHALAAAIQRLWGDERAGAQGLERIRAYCAPEVVAAGLAAVYEQALADGP
jgi:glycosyltransferase involved in cell wall biosynthesis